MIRMMNPKNLMLVGTLMIAMLVAVAPPGAAGWWSVDAETTVNTYYTHAENRTTYYTQECKDNTVVQVGLYNTATICSQKVGAPGSGAPST